MNRITPLQWVMVALTLMLLAGGSYVWFHYMEKRWVAVPQQATAAIRNPMLVAERLLRGRGYDSRADLTLPLLLQQPLPAGTIVLTDNRGVMTEAQAEALLEWVSAGNTLVLRPQWQSVEADEDDDEEALTELVERDPIGQWFGVSQTYRPAKKAAESTDADANSETGSATDSEIDSESGADTEVSAELTGGSDGGNDETDGITTEAVDEPAEPTSAPPAKTPKKPPHKRVFNYARLQLPSHANLLLIEQNLRLVNAEDGAVPDLSDEAGDSIQIFNEGNGQVVFLANEPFNNRSIRAADHAELLLALAALNASGKSVRFVTELDMPAWYEALWQQFRWALVSVLAVILIWLWRAVVRFGPLKAEPDPARRAQLEHVQASARWLWRLAGGREQMLAAVRADVEAILRRQLPQLQRLSVEAGQQLIAEHFQLPLTDVVLALHAPAAHLPVDFTRQIHLLQLMRQHHDRID